MSTRNGILLLVAIAALSWIGCRYYRTHSGRLAAAYAPAPYCPPPVDGSFPYRVKGLPQIESIQFAHGEILVARDRVGRLWRYVPVFGGSCVKTHPERVFPGPAFSEAKPPVTEVHTARSTASDLAYVTTGQRRVVMFQPYEVANICGFHGRVCPLADAGLTDVVDVAGGGMHRLVARADGSIWATGLNDCGQLGIPYGNHSFTASTSCTT